jgi:tetratricopeptide (TPR) repeat protein
VFHRLCRHVALFYVLLPGKESLTADSFFLLESSFDQMVNLTQSSWFISGTPSAPEPYRFTLFFQCSPLPGLVDAGYINNSLYSSYTARRTPMCRWTSLLCLACFGCVGCFACSLPFFSSLAMVPVLAVQEKTPQPHEVDQTEKLLEQAAAALAQGQELAAAVLLEKHLEREPQHLFIRAQVAELFFRQQKWEPSHRHFQECVALSQELGDPAYSYLIHAHSRLVDIAEAEQNVFAEHLHRGLGLYELACHRAKVNDVGKEPSVADILGRAALSLQDARNEDPNAARPHWYLHLIWSRLGQHQAAKQALLQADERKFFAGLTQREKRELQMARWQEASLSAGIGGERGVR